MKHYLKEVTGILQGHAAKYGPATPSYYSTNLPFLGAIPVPEQRRLNCGAYSFHNLSAQEQDKLWDFIWHNGENFETLSQALIYFDSRKAVLTLQHWNILKRWSERVDNWAHSDSLSGIYAHLHERFPKTLYPVFAGWNKSKQPWKRRLSIVSLFYYARVRKVHPPYSLVEPLVMNLLHDDHLYVQKGFGWTLREMYNVYPKKTFALLKKIAHEIPPAGWYAATEKLSVEQKKALMKLRKKGRR